MDAQYSITCLEPEWSSESHIPGNYRYHALKVIMLENVIKYDNISENATGSILIL